MDIDSPAAHHAAFSHSPSYDCGMGSHATASGEDSLGCKHTTNIFGRGFGPNKDHLFSAQSGLFGIFRVEYDLAHGCPR